MRRYK